MSPVATVAWIVVDCVGVVRREALGIACFSVTKTSRAQGRDALSVRSLEGHPLRLSDARVRGTPRVSEDGFDEFRDDDVVELVADVNEL